MMFSRRGGAELRGLWWCLGQWSMEPVWALVVVTGTEEPMMILGATGLLGMLRTEESMNVSPRAAKLVVVLGTVDLVYFFF